MQKFSPFEGQGQPGHGMPARRLTKYCLVAGATVALVQLLVTLLSFSIGFGDFDSGRVGYSTYQELQSSLRSFQWRLSASSDNDGYPVREADHPIYRLVRDAEKRWLAKSKTVTTTLPAARSRYTAKYGLTPPQAFDDWWAAAQNEDYPFVDEHDLLMSKLAPFRDMPADEVQRRTWEIGFQQSFSMVHIRNGSVIVTQPRRATHTDVEEKIRGRANGMAYSLRPIAHLLPDMTFAVNEMPQPRVLPYRSQDTPSWTEGEVFDFKAALHTGKESVWEAFRETCPPTSSARGAAGEASGRLPAISRKDLYNSSKPLEPPRFGYGPTVYTHAQICETPDLHLLHSQFFDDYRPLKGFWPLFSVSTQDGYGDIPFPSDFYLDRGYSKNYHVPEPKLDKESWDKRHRKVFWRGATNPGWNFPAGHQRDFPRRRFLEMTSSKQPRDSFVDVAVANQQSGSFELRRTNLSEINEEVMDTAFTGLWNCGPPQECASLKKDFPYRWANQGSISEVGKHKLLLDLDGLAYSARFLALLKSGGAVIKSTLYQEFFTEWMEPWYHYIPLSNEFKEIYSIFAFFEGLPTDTPQNDTDTAAHRRQHMLRQIGLRGSDWTRLAGGNDIINIYIYRLALEWARIYRGDDWKPRSPDPQMERLDAKRMKMVPELFKK